jgi:cell wall-associated NlpC family hydrolase
VCVCVRACVRERVATIVDTSSDFIARPELAHTHALRSRIHVLAHRNTYSHTTVQGAGVRYFRGVITDATVRAGAAAAVQAAKKELGKPYAEQFQQPSSGEFYCSSLVEYAYQQATDLKLIFTNETFYLLFVPEEFWKK